MLIQCLQYSLAVPCFPVRLESITYAWCVRVCHRVCVRLWTVSLPLLRKHSWHVIYCTAPYCTAFVFPLGICVSSCQFSPKGRLTQLAPHTILYWAAYPVGVGGLYLPVVLQGTWHTIP